MDLKRILIGFIIIVALVVLYRYFFTDPTQTNLLTLGSGKDAVMKRSTMLSGNAESAYFTYSMWIYVKDWNYKLGKDKVIINRLANNGNSTPIIKLGQSTNDLNISVEIYTDVEETEGGLTKMSDVCSVSNIPLQKWTHVAVSVNNRSLDTYIDGKLVKTCLLEGAPKIDGTSPVHICPPNGSNGENGFDGHVAKVRYYSRALNPREIYEIYKEGYSGSLLGSILNKYRLRFSYIKDNEEVGSLEI